MSPIHIDEMTVAVLDALSLPDTKRELVATALRTHWDGKVALVWTRTDITRICDLNGWKRPDVDAADAFLDSLLLQTAGVTTDTIERLLCEAGMAVPL